MLPEGFLNASPGSVALALPVRIQCENLLIVFGAAWCTLLFSALGAVGPPRNFQARPTHPPSDTPNDLQEIFNDGGGAIETSAGRRRRNPGRDHAVLIRHGGAIPQHPPVVARTPTAALTLFHGGVASSPLSMAALPPPSTNPAVVALPRPWRR